MSHKITGGRSVKNGAGVYEKEPNSGRGEGKLIPVDELILSSLKDFLMTVLPNSSFPFSRLMEFQPGQGLQRGDYTPRNTFTLMLSCDY